MSDLVDILGSRNGHTYHVSTELVAWRVVDGEAVVIHTDTSEYFGLNPAGTYLWSLMVEQACHQSDLVEGISARYELNETDARSHVDAFLTKLEGAQLVQALPGADEGTNGNLDGVPSPQTGPYEAPDLVKFGDLETLILSGE